jgi:hypothetical protein
LQKCSAVPCSAVPCSAVQCRAVQCSAVQCSAVPYVLVCYYSVKSLSLLLSLMLSNIARAAAVFATLAVVATATSQIFTSTYQKSLDCNALQLLYHTSPIIGAVSNSIVTT